MKLINKFLHLILYSISIVFKSATFAQSSFTLSHNDSHQKDQDTT